MTSLIDHPVL